MKRNPSTGAVITALTVVSGISISTIAIASLSSIAIAPAATAATVTLTPAGDITSLKNLKIPGQGTYNVTFHTGSYDNHFSDEPTFLDNQAGAEAAVAAITEQIGENQAIAPYQIPYEAQTNDGGPTINLINSDGSPSSQASSSGGTWAKFTIVTGIYDGDDSENVKVPEPSTLLGASTVFGLSLLARRRKQTQETQ